jgi:hypothetical protein
VVLVFAVLLFIASKAGLAGLPLALILTSWFFKYAYILFDHTVRGFAEPPTLDIQMMNPLDELRPLAQLVILGLLYGGVKVVQVTVSPTAALFLAALAVLLLPASVAELGLESSFLKAIYPVAIVKMIAGLGTTYLLVLAIIAGYVVALTALGKMGLWLPVQLALDLFAVLSLFSMLGGALYERRHELGLETWHSPERTAELERAADRRQSETALTEAYGQVRVGEHVKAWQMLQAWLASRGHQVEDYHWLGERVAAWNDPRYANRLTEEYVDRLLALRRGGEALQVVAHRLRLDPSFRPKSAESTLHLARLASVGGARGMARTLLADFGARFASDPRLPAANALARHLGE